MSESLVLNNELRKNMSSVFAVISRPFVKVRDCIRGVAAVEFGLLLPILLIFWLGSNELGQALMLDRRVTTTTSTVADLIAQTGSLTVAQVDEILELSDVLMAPALMSLYKSNKFKITVMNIEKDGDGNLTVRWSREKTGAGAGAAGDYPKDSTVTAAQIDPNFDADVILPNSQQIIAKAEYDYTPTVGRVIKENYGGTIKLSEIFFLAPRQGAVDCDDC